MHNSQNLNTMKLIKNTINKSKKIFLVLLLSGITIAGLAQDPPPPPGGDGSENTNTGSNQLGGAAHVGGGVLILLTLAVAYGGRRIYELRKEASTEA